MIRESAVAMVFGAVLAGAASAQQSIGVSATILERVEAEAVEVQVRSSGGRLAIESPESSAQGTGLLRATYVVSGALTGADQRIPVRVQDGSIKRLERRTVSAGRMTGEKMEAGETLFIDAAEQLIVTRVVASNS